MNEIEKTEIVKYILAEPQRIATASKVVEAFDNILWDVAVRFRDAIQLDLKADSYIVDESYEETDPNDWNYFGLRANRKGWPDGCWVSIESQAKKLRQFIIGCQWNIKTRTRDEIENDLRKKLNEQCGNGRKSDHWVWYKAIDEKYVNWSNSATLESLAYSLSNKDGISVRHVTDELRKIGTIISDVFVK